MKIRMIGLMLGATALAVWGAGCEQPKIDCRATRGLFIATFKAQGDTSAMCAQKTLGQVGLQSYYAKGDDGKVDVSRSMLAIQAEDFNYEITPALDLIDQGCADENAVTTNVLNSEGPFAGTEPNDQGICSAANQSAQEFSSAEIMPSGDPMDMDNPCATGLPAQTIKYEWRNVNLYVSPDAPGSRFQADLTYTENGCTANYKVCGLWPVVGCEKLKWVTDTDPACGDEDTAPDTCQCPGQPGGCAVGTGEPENKLCDGEPDLEIQYSIPAGSGINTDFKPICDPDGLVCVLPKCPF